MSEFDAGTTLREVNERHAQLTMGQKIVPVVTAIIAVMGALATLSAHHRSTAALAQKNEGVLLQTKASDQYNYYDSTRMRVQLSQTLIAADLVKPGSQGYKILEEEIRRDTAQSRAIFDKAESLETASGAAMERADHAMHSYENAEVAAALFQVSIVLASITALTRTRAFLIGAAGLSLLGLAFFIVGYLA
ncbi:MAG TPA: DUF4337 family protein [Candidatus Baltobacteraceae bacterium]|nr:DUF4337 family protein [Candidatus Baltobacteraceae bacterium]